MSKAIIPLSALIASVMLCQPASAQSVTWQAMFDQGKQQAGSGNYSEAEKSYVSALESAEKFSPTDPRLLQTVKALAFVYTQDGKLGKAKDLFKRAVSVDEPVNNGVSRKLAVDLDNLAAVCYRQENYFEAEPLYKQAIEIWRKLSSGQADQGMSSTEAADDQAKLAMVYERTGKYVEGESLFKTAIETYQSGAPATNKQMATALTNLSSFYRKQGKLPEAEKVCRQALDLRKAACGPESVEVAASMIELGKIYMEEDNPGKYEPLFKQALTIRENALSADHPDIADSLVQLAAGLQMQNKYNQALPLLQRALAIDEVAYGQMHPEVARITALVAVILDQKKQYSRAASLLQKAYDIDKQVAGENSSALAKVATNQANTYLNQGQYEAAEEKYKEALAITEKQRGADHPDTATCLTSLAWLYQTQSKFSDALPLLKRALIIRSTAFAPTHPWVAKSLSNLGSVYDAQKDYANAEKFLQTARKVAIQALGNDHPDVAQITLELANVCQQEKKYKEAEDLFTALLERDKAVAGATSPAVALDLMKLSHLALLQGHKQQAEELKAQARQANTKVSDLEAAAVVTTAAGNEAPSTAGTGSGGHIINDKWALVVGISNFKDPSINLRYAAKDATDFRNYLIDEAHFAPDHVKLLTDKAATRDGIVSNLGDQWLGHVADSNDMVVVYISSHGSPANEKTSHENFLVTYETNFSNLLLTGIPMKLLTGSLKDLINCDHVIMMLDVCHGGAAAPSEETGEETPTTVDPYRTTKLAGGKGMERQVDPRQLKLGNGQIVVASSEASQLSWESKSYPNGVFTRRLIEALRQSGDKTRLSDAFENMKLKVEEEVLRDRAEVQTPIIFRKWQGEDAMLGVPPAKPHKPTLATAAESGKNEKSTGSKGSGGKR